MLGVDDEGKGTTRHFAEESGLTFTILDDSSYKAHRLYRVYSIPRALLIDRDGTLRSALKVVGL